MFTRALLLGVTCRRRSPSKKRIGLQERKRTYKRTPTNIFVVNPNSTVNMKLTKVSPRNFYKDNLECSLYFLDF